MGAAAGVGDGPTTGAQLMYIIYHWYYVWFPHCFWGIIRVCVLNRLTWVVAWEAGMGWEIVKVGSSESLLIVSCVGGWWEK